MARAKELTVLDDVLEVLAGLPGVRVTLRQVEPVVNGMRLDAVLDLDTPNGTHTYAVEVRTSVTRSVLNAVVAQLRHTERISGCKLLLVTPRVPDALVEELIEAGVDFVDAAGNMHLQAPGLYLLVRGRKPTPPYFPARNAFTATGLRVVYALMAYPRLRKGTYRDIKDATGVGLGSVGRTVKGLLEQGYLLEGRDGTLHLARFRDLLFRWELGYLETLRPKLAPTAWRYTGVDRREALEKLRQYPAVLIGGEEAAARLTSYLKPRTLTLHADSAVQKNLRAALKLLPAWESPDVYLLRLPIPCDLTRAAGDRLVSPLLVRAELLAYGGDRLREVADRLLESVGELVDAD